MSDRANMLARVRRTVQDTELEISDAMLDQAIDDAVEVYSKDVPRKTVVDVSGNGTSIYLILTILPGYIDGYSVLDKIEYPLTGTSPPTLPPHCYEIQRRPDGNGNPALYLVFVGGQRPASSSSFRVVYTIMHLSDCSTIVASDRIAVSYLSAAHALDLYATATMDSIDSSIDADVFDRTATTERARRAAKMYRDLYREMVGVDDNDDGGRREVPANTTISWSRRRRTHEQPPYLTH